MSHSGTTDLSTTYQKKTQKEHIKDAPDTYIGAVEPDQVKNWSFQGESITFHDYIWTPGFYKLFDEAIVNCRDHYVRLQQKIKSGQKDIIPVTLIDIAVDKETGIITLMNLKNAIQNAQPIIEVNLFIFAVFLQPISCAQKS